MLGFENNLLDTSDPQTVNSWMEHLEQYFPELRPQISAARKQPFVVQRHVTHGAVELVFTDRQGQKSYEESRLSDQEAEKKAENMADRIGNAQLQQLADQWQIGRISPSFHDTHDALSLHRLGASWFCSCISHPL